MRIATTVQQMRDARIEWAVSNEVGFVPTMGYLHEGHLSLVRHARAENKLVVVSIFVNPTQFAPHEDLERYPRDVPRDLQLLEAAAVDIVFIPTLEEIYPSGFVTYVEPTGPLAEQAEGARRPGHFRGVATVVLKLFQLVQPHQAYFGQKDAQQAAVISRMAADFHLPLRLHVLPIIREADGLAMSSRNVYLSPEDRFAATVLYRALQAGRLAFEERPAGNAAAVTRAMTDVVASEPRAVLDYAEVRDPHSFLLLESLHAPAVLVIAVQIGSVRLIDNFLLRADGSWDVGIALQ
ncbi:MAG: pantoate--beta-alanine ligase [Chloroflexi bacterium]|nr:pantoate--beta-alanine ligase [Chloroflexota bacterium]